MEPKTLALYVMIVLGGCAVAAFIYVVVRRKRSPADGKDPMWKPISLVVFGFALLGVGGYGPAFLTDYAEFLKMLANLSPEQRLEGYRTTVARIAEGNMPPEYRDLATAYMLRHPVDGLEQILGDAAERAPEETRQFLMETKAEVIRQRETADLAVKGATEPGGTAPEIRRLDRTTLEILEEKPRDRLEELRIDPQVLRDELRSRGLRRP